MSLSPSALVSLPGLPALRVTGEVLPPEPDAGIPYRRWESSDWTGVEGPLTPEQECAILDRAGELNDAAFAAWRDGGGL